MRKSRLKSRILNTLSHKVWGVAPFVLSLVLASSLVAQPLATSQSHLQAPTALHSNGESNPLAVGSGALEFEWTLTAANPHLRDVRQTKYRILVASSEKKLADGAADLWDSGVVAGTVPANIRYEGGPLVPSTHLFWKVRVWDEANTPGSWSEPASFTTAPALSSDGKTFVGARWIAAPNAVDREGADKPMPVFRKQFQVAGTVRRAILSISGMGQEEARINGTAVNADTLSPGWTNFRKTVLYDTYDVTALIKPGANAVGVLLGNGMYNVQETAGRFTKLTASFGVPKCIASLRLEMADGQTRVISTDATWDAADGPITFSSTYGGEDNDARLEQAAQSSSAAWKSAATVDGPGGLLTPEIPPTVKAIKTYPSISRTVLPSGAVVYDLGQNIAGWPSIRVHGAAGATVKIIPGELLDANGAVTQKSEGGGSGLAWFTYVLKGGAASEQWHPRFSYYGFRYIQVELGTPSGSAPATIEQVAGIAVHSARPDVGSFHSSNEMLNRIHTLILRAMENNTVSIFTDCPHREKLGWLEETQLMANSMLWNADLRGVYAATATNIRDSQQPNGMVPSIAPQYTVFGGSEFNDSPEWGAAAILAPWMLFQQYGDLHALRDAWPVMQRYAAYLHTRADDGILAYGLGDWYDIGPGAPGLSKLTTLGVTGTATYYQELLAMHDAATALNDESAQRYLQEAGQIKAAFQKHFWKNDKQWYDRGSQTAQAMPLALGMVPEDSEKRTLQVLIDDIQAHQNHVTSGEVGYAYMIRALIAAHRDDVLLAMLMRTDPPSYGSQLAAGATALTEAWDANPTSSQDHFMLGDADSWFYQGLGGLHIDMSLTPDDRIRIAPQMPQGVDSVDVAYRSAVGEIRSQWHRRHEQAGERLQMDVSIPPGAVAWIQVAAKAQEGTVLAASTRGVLRSRNENGKLWLLAGSGDYHFDWLQ